MPILSKCSTNYGITSQHWAIIHVLVPVLIEFNSFNKSKQNGLNFFIRTIRLGILEQYDKCIDDQYLIIKLGKEKIRIGFSVLILLFSTCLVDLDKRTSNTSILCLSKICSNNILNSVNFPFEYSWNNTLAIEPNPVVYHLLGCHLALYINY